MILTKDQRRSKANKKKIEVRKSRCIELDRIYCYIRKFNIALSLYRVLGIILYFFEDFSGTTIGVSIAAKVL